jgi:DNA-binding MarR family transcriptional regulator
MNRADTIRFRAARRPRSETSRAVAANLARDAAALHDAVSALVRVYQFRDRSAICCHDVSVTQCHALDALARDGGLSLGDLASRLRLDKSTTSRVVDALERKGYARRGADARDRRGVRVAATARGRALCARIERELIDEAARQLAGTTPTARAAVIAILRELAAAAARRCAGGDACCRFEGLDT